MLPTNLFTREILEDLRRRRSLVFKFTLPVVLMLPFALVNMDGAVRASGLPLIVLFLGVLGTSVGLAKLRESKMSDRLAALPVSRRRMIFQHLGANILMDGLEVVLPASIIIYSLGVAGNGLLLVICSLILSLIMANAIGSLLAMISGGSGEVHLYSGIAVLVFASASGLFFRDLPAGMSILTDFMPFASLSAALMQDPIGSVGWQLAGSTLLTSLFLSLVWLFAPRFFRS